ncbi:hypothetical protein F5I97DRAFT_1804577 [Phlebopus sp. FC_14]|nr:hypothetical protein F5I97DRAFT_1804577 [Phlebopus sp. FC_14]
MPHYINPLHPPVPTEIHSPYTALSNACPIFHPPFPTQLPPPSYKRVPQRTPANLDLLHRRSSPCIPIMFDLIGAPSRGLGIPMRELVVRSGGALERMLVDASEPVGSRMTRSGGVRKVTFRIMWPGYEHANWCPCFDLYTSKSPLTRGQLAVQIAQGYFDFIKHMTSYGVPSQGGMEWRLGTSGISFERLILVAFWNVCDDNWMAEVFVDYR